MDLSVQKMQPPASVQGKSAAKRTNQADSEEAVETVARDQDVRFKHGNTGYDKQDGDDQATDQDRHPERQQRRKNRQLLSGADLSELTVSMQQAQDQSQSADGLMNLRAYQNAPNDTEEDDNPHFEVNI